ncbi:unnamed protein product [Eruca vesicaria subsp. sativa]|uniref:BAH domain-containing protein n=1 Tax=Eruca vesicaria subsp. sativa TaxID=29727 RepID=A0ABC8LYT8_ERUVS|nr:unnamed protein product [Eruca vesicaria subsp. sativa]
MALSRSLAQVPSSDGEENFVLETRSQERNSTSFEEKMDGKRRKRKMVYQESDDDEEEKERNQEDEERKEAGEKSHGVKPVGEPVKVTGKGKERIIHYRQFEYGGNRYHLEDSVLLNPQPDSEKPYVAFIKDITQRNDGRMMIMVQWFYRPEEAEKKGGGNWVANDTREVFYSFHCDEADAESVMHRCVVYFVPAHKQLPKRKQNPGFIVRKVYDTDEKKLRKLTDKDYDVEVQHEIDLLVEKSMSRLGDLPDLETEENVEKTKRSSRKVISLKSITSSHEAEKKATEESLKTTNDFNADNNPEGTK